MTTVAMILGWVHYDDLPAAMAAAHMQAAADKRRAVTIEWREVPA